MIKNKSRLKKNLPNIITIIRIVLVFVIIVIGSIISSLYVESTSTSFSLFIQKNNYQNINTEFILWIVFFVFFALAALTDFFDGYFARKFNAVSRSGKVLDSIADKMLTIVALVFLSIFETVFLWLSLFLIMRDIVITSIRIIYSKYNKLIEAQWHGKLKTVMLFIGILFGGFFGPLLQHYINDTQLLIFATSSVLLIALALSLYSLVAYMLSIYRFQKCDRKLIT